MPLNEDLREGSDAPYRDFGGGVDGGVAGGFGVGGGEVRRWQWGEPYGEEGGGMGEVDSDGYLASERGRLASGCFSGVGRAVGGVEVARRKAVGRPGRVARL
jgi:hypothetical protein